MDGGVKRLAAVERHLSPLVAVGASSSGAPRRLRLAHLASYFHRNYKAAPAADILTHFEAFVDALFAFDDDYYVRRGYGRPAKPATKKRPRDADADSGVASSRP